MTAIMERLTKISLFVALSGLGVLSGISESRGDNLCRDKKTRVVTARPGACTRKEVAIAFTKDFEQECAAGQYAHLIPKKYQPKPAKPVAKARRRA